MITSDKQYIAAKEQLHMLKKSLLSDVKNNVPAVIEEAGKAQIKELIAEIEASINEYENIIKNTRNNAVIEIHSLDDLLAAPIRYRLANHMSIDNFSRKVGVSARQIARYEKEEYQNINARTLQKILKNLEVRIDGKIAKSA
jgi:DNA-binding Xre family transcriptional regulator